MHPSLERGQALTRIDRIKPFFNKSRYQNRFQAPFTQRLFGTVTNIIDQDGLTIAQNPADVQPTLGTAARRRSLPLFNQGVAP